MLSVTIKTVECCQKPETVKCCQKLESVRCCQKPETVKYLVTQLIQVGLTEHQSSKQTLRATLDMQMHQEELTELEFASHRAKSQCLQNHLVAKAQEEFYL
jgi:hypothetical protein